MTGLFHDCRMGTIPCLPILAILISHLATRIRVLAGHPSTDVDDETMVWSVSIQGLTGNTEIEESELGEIAKPTPVGEGAF